MRFEKDNKNKKGIQEKQETAKLQKEEDYNFDFSIYEIEEKKLEGLKSSKQKKPRITNLRSKFSPSMMELESLTALKINISELGIKVASNTQEITELWNFYGCIDEYWARIKDIFGTIINKEMDSLQRQCRIRLTKANQEAIIPYQTHRFTLKYRDRIYSIAQRANLGIEVEKTSFSHYDKAKKGIIE